MKFLVGVSGKEFVIYEEDIESVEEFLEEIFSDNGGYFFRAKQLVLGVELKREFLVRLKSIDFVSEFEEYN